jgi:hypothetical protein
MRPDLAKRLEVVAAVLEGTADMTAKAVLAEKEQLRQKILASSERIRAGSLTPNALAREIRVIERHSIQLLHNTK